jgi:HEAT repeat protein
MNETVRNEPEIKIKGGAIRTSKRIDRTELPALLARERVIKLLRDHCPDSQGSPLSALSDSELAEVRIIAQEGAVSNTEANVRYNAIAALAASGTPENLNVLANLAHFGEDFYVRGHALLALGATGMQIALPAIVGHLTATDKFEQSAARRAIALLAKKTSIESVKAHASLLDRKSKSEVSQIFADLVKGKKRSEVHKTPQRINKG